VCRDFDLASVTTPPNVPGTMLGRQGEGGLPPRLRPVRSDVNGARTVDDRTGDNPEGMFGAFSSRRKRFSFFWN